MTGSAHEEPFQVISTIHDGCCSNGDDGDNDGCFFVCCCCLCVWNFLLFCFGGASWDVFRRLERGVMWKGLCRKMGEIERRLESSMAAMPCECSSVCVWMRVWVAACRLQMEV